MKRVVSVIVVLILVCNLFNTVSFAEEVYRVISSVAIETNSIYVVTLDKAVNITGYSIYTSYKYSGTTPRITLRFYNSSDVHIYSKTIGSYFETENISLTGVKKIIIENESYRLDSSGAQLLQPIFINYLDLYIAGSTPPKQVQNVRVKDMTSTSVTITWDPNPGAEKYIVYLDGQNYGETTNTEYTIDGLQSNTSYTVVIAAVNKAGEGPPSEPCTFTTPEPPPEPPTKVMNVNVKDMTATSATITWDPNPEPEGVLKYVIYLNGQKYGETTNTEYKIDNLQPNTSYEVTITAVNSDGEGPPSDPCTFRTPELPPEPATQVKNIVIKGLTSTSATISWAPNPGAERITKYIIYLNGEKYGETEDTEYVIDGLKEGEKYTVTVAAVNALGEGPTSDPIVFITSKIVDISSTIKIQDILSSITVLFTNLWPLVAFVLALIAIVPITGTLKQIFRRRSNA
jgi:predicted RNA-binding protein with TRAM domain/chitodextrinase